MSVQSELARLATEVTELTTVNSSIKALAAGLATRLRALIAQGPATEASIKEFADALDAEAGTLATAVTENTVAEEETPVDPPVDPPVEPSSGRGRR